MRQNCPSRLSPFLDGNREQCYALGGFHIWRPQWVGGSPKSRRKEQNQLICDSDKGGRGSKILRSHIWKPPWDSIAMLSSPEGDRQRTVRRRHATTFRPLSLSLSLLPSPLSPFLSSVLTERSRICRSVLPHSLWLLQYSPLPLHSEK